jgi:hypothetical protein
MRRLTRFSLRSLLVVTVLVTLFQQNALAQQCAQPVSSGAAPVASDCLFILGVAVGSQTCLPACTCAPTGSLPTKATDALLCLSRATGQPVTLNCPCEEPPDADRIIGEANASRGRLIFPPFFPGLPTTVTDDFYIDAMFTKIEIIGDPPDVDRTETVETFGACTVTTVELIAPNGGAPPFTITNYDPGAPGQASNGTQTVDLLRYSGGGFESFAPDFDVNLYDLGFDGGQTVTFSWPGGDHINAFTDSIAVPPVVTITAPDLESGTFDVVPGEALDLTWDDDGKLTVTVATSNSTLTQQTLESHSVTIVCEFAEGSGAATIPAGATAKLLEAGAPPAIYSRNFTASRVNSKEVNVSAPTVGGSRVVVLTATSELTRSLYFAFPFSLGLTGGR